MAISDELNDLQTYLGNAYTKLGLKGATIPQNKNMYNLENCVDSITPYAPPVIPTSAGTLTSISVTSNPTKTVYNENEPLDLTGVVITALYSSGNSYNVTQGCSFTCNNPVTLSDTQIIVNYGGQTASISITVNALPIPAPATTKGLWHLDTTRDLNEVTNTSYINITNTTGKFITGVTLGNNSQAVPININWNNRLGLNPVSGTNFQFTIEFWCYFKESGAGVSFKISSAWNVGTDHYISRNSSTGQVTLTNGIFSGGTSYPQSCALNTWYHIAIVINGNSKKAYFNGVLLSEATNTNSMDLSYILLRDLAPRGTCYVDEILFCMEAKYSGDFTPPQAPYYIGSNT